MPLEPKRLEKRRRKNLSMEISRSISKKIYVVSFPSGGREEKPRPYRLGKKKPSDQIAAKLYCQRTSRMGIWSGGRPSSHQKGEAQVILLRSVLRASGRKSTPGYPPPLTENLPIFPLHHHLARQMSPSILMPSPLATLPIMASLLPSTPGSPPLFLHPLDSHPIAF